MKNFNSPGNTITVTAPAAVTSGVPFVYGDVLAVPVASAALGAPVACTIEGVFVLPKASADVIAGGAKVNWDDAAKQVAAAGTFVGFGIAVDAAGAGTTTVRVKLTPGSGA